VFVPGSNCFGEVRGLFGGAARRLVVPGARALPIDNKLAERGVLLALAATAYHATSGAGMQQPDLIVGHGVLGRMIARLAVLAGAAPVVWETNAGRREGAQGYEVIDPATDTRRNYKSICDVSGDASLLDTLISRLAPGGEVVLAGFLRQAAVIRVPARLHARGPHPYRCPVAAHRPGPGAQPGIESGRAVSGRPDHPPRRRQRCRRRLPHCLWRSCLSEDDSRLENLPMSTSSIPASAPVTFMMKDKLRAEAAIEPSPVATGPVTKETQIIAIYGKGGIGKSFTLANLSYMMASRARRCC
jgi:hypothetical protein